MSEQRNRTSEAVAVAAAPGPADDDIPDDILARSTAIAGIQSDLDGFAFADDEQGAKIAEEQARAAAENVPSKLPYDFVKVAMDESTFASEQLLNAARGVHYITDIARPDGSVLAGRHVRVVSLFIQRPLSGQVDQMVMFGKTMRFPPHIMEYCHTFWTFGAFSAVDATSDKSRSVLLYVDFMTVMLMDAFNISINIESSTDPEAPTNDYVMSLTLHANDGESIIQTRQKCMDYITKNILPIQRVMHLATFMNNPFHPGARTIHGPTHTRAIPFVGGMLTEMNQYKGYQAWLAEHGYTDEDDHSRPEVLEEFNAAMEEGRDGPLVVASEVDAKEEARRYEQEQMAREEAVYAEVREQNERDARTRAVDLDHVCAHCRGDGIEPAKCTHMPSKTPQWTGSAPLHNSVLHDSIDEDEAYFIRKYGEEELSDLEASMKESINDVWSRVEYYSGVRSRPTTRISATCCQSCIAAGRTSPDCTHPPKGPTSDFGPS